MMHQLSLNKNFHFGKSDQAQIYIRTLPESWTGPARQPLTVLLFHHQVIVSMMAHVNIMHKSQRRWCTTWTMIMIHEIQDRVKTTTSARDFTTACGNNPDTYESIPPAQQKCTSTIRKRSPLLIPEMLKISNDKLTENIHASRSHQLIIRSKRRSAGKCFHIKTIIRMLCDI